MSDATPEQPFPMRLQKFLARAGVASRRGSEDLMTAGRVSVNGQIVTELGSKVDPKVDVVCVDGREVHLEDGSVYLMLHKPKGYLTTMDDPQGRPCVAQLVPRGRYPGLFPVGRLDKDTTGLLLFTTDGDMGQRLLHPKHHMSRACPTRSTSRVCVAASCSTTVSRPKHGCVSSPNVPMAVPTSSSLFTRDASGRSNACARPCTTRCSTCTEAVSAHSSSSMSRRGLGDC